MHFSKNAALIIHDLIIEETGGRPGLRDEGALESCLKEPFQKVFSYTLHKSDFERAATLLRLIALNHPFIDGNKRTAMALALTYLQDKDIQVSITDNEYESFMIEVVTKKLSNRQISRWLSNHENK